MFIIKSELKEANSPLHVSIVIILYITFIDI